MTGALKLRERSMSNGGKHTFREWLTQVVGDLERIGQQWRWEEDGSSGLRLRPGRLWIVPSVGLPTAKFFQESNPRDNRAYYPFEVLIGYRAPKTDMRLPDGPNALGLQPDIWAAQTARFAAALFAHPSWVRFAEHLFNPMAIPWHPLRTRHIDLAAEVWARLLGIPVDNARARYVAQLTNREARKDRSYRGRFWVSDVRYEELAGLADAV